MRPWTNLPQIVSGKLARTTRMFLNRLKISNLTWTYMQSWIPALVLLYRNMGLFKL